MIYQELIFSWSKTEKKMSEILILIYWYIILYVIYYLAYALFLYLMTKI